MLPYLNNLCVKFDSYLSRIQIPMKNVDLKDIFKLSIADFGKLVYREIYEDELNKFISFGNDLNWVINGDLINIVFSYSCHDNLQYCSSSYTINWLSGLNSVTDIYDNCFECTTSKNRIYFSPRCRDTILYSKVPEICYTTTNFELTIKLQNGKPTYEFSYCAT